MARIKVIDKTTGQSGTIEDWDLDPNKFDVVGGASQPNTASTMGGVKGTIRKGSELLNTLGLGAVPGAAASIYEIPGMVGRGFQKRSVEEAAQDNPFLTGQKQRSLIKARTEGIGENIKQAGKETAGLASWMINPMSKATLPVKMGAAALSGGLSNMSQEDSTAGSVATSAGISSLFPPVFKAGGAVLNKVGKAGKDLVLNIFKPSSAMLDDFRKFVKLDFVDEFLKRDAKNVSKMGDDEMVNYFSSKSKDTIGKVNDYLKQTGEYIESSDFFNSVKEVFNSKLKYETGENKLLQAPARKKILEIMRDYIGISEDQMEKMIASKQFLPLEMPPIRIDTFNMMKSDLQDAASSFYNNGKKTSASSAVADIARKFGDLIETRVPEVKQMNQSTQYYKVALDALQKRVDLLKTSGGFIKNITGQGLAPGLIGGALGALTGNPLTAALTGAGVSVGSAALNTMTQSPSIVKNISKKLIGAGKASVPDFIKKLLPITTGKGVGAIMGKPSEPSVIPTPTETPELPPNQFPPVGDIADTTNVETQTEVAPETETTPSQYEITPEMVKMARLMYSDKIADRIEKAYNAQFYGQQWEKKLSGGEAKKTELQQKFSNAASAGEKALALIKSGTVKSGLGQKQMGALGETFGFNSENQQTYRSTLAIARTAVRNAMLGANMTPKELESIQAFIPEFDDAPNIAEYKLNTFILLMNEFGKRFEGVVSNQIQPSTE